MKKVLIVEDQRMPRENMERITFRQWQIRTFCQRKWSRCCAGRLQTGTDRLDFDGCMHSGNKDGIEAATEIKAEFPDIK